MRTKILAFGWIVLALASAFADPPKPTPEQQAKLKERDTLVAEADKLEVAGKYKEAATRVVKILVIERSVLGEKHADVLASLQWLAELHEQAEDRTAAKTAWLELARLRGEVFGKQYWRTIDATLAAAKSGLIGAMTAEQRAEWARSKKLTADVMKLHGQGKFADALPVAEKVLAIHKTLFGTRHPQYAISLSNLALLHDNLGRYALAEKPYVEVADIFKEVVGDAHPNHAHALNNLALLYQAQGYFRKAEPILLKAVAILKATIGESNAEYGRMRNNLAALYEVQGRYAQAEPLYLEFLKITKATVGESHADYATGQNNLAMLYERQGLYAKAEPRYKEALRIRKAALGTAHPDYAASLNNLAGLYCELEKYAEAEPLYEETVRLTKATLGDAHPRYAAAINNLATVIDKLGKPDEAERLYARSLEIRKAAVGKDHPSIALALSNIAALHKQRGKLDESEKLYAEALRIRKAALGERHPDYASNLNDLGRVYVLQNRDAEAEPLLRQSVRIIQDHLEETATIQSEADQLQAVAVSRAYLNDYLALGNVDAAFRYAAVYRWHGSVMARQAFARAALLGKPEAREKIEQLRDIARELNRLAQGFPGDSVEVKKTLADLEDRREELQKTIARESADFEAYRRHLALTPTDLQKSLPEGTVFVEYFVHAMVISAFIVGPKTIEHVELESSPELVADILEFRGELSLSRTRPVTHANDVAVRLRKRIWLPIEPHLEGIKTVMICPDGLLSQVPFGALPGADPKKYLLEERAITVVPVPQLYGGKPPVAEGPPTLLAVGDVDFDAGEPGPNRGGLAWKALPETKNEVETIAQLFFQQPKADIVQLTGRSATAANLEKKMPGRRVVHLATHGFFSTPRLVRKHTDAGDRAVEVPSVPPGLSSGIVCAGANTSGSVLTATQIAELDLRSVNLAVLSACETGLGEMKSGQGVLGLQRAFQLAGARSTITSLWAIPDKATAELMKRMYERHLKDGVPAADALREAQLWVLNNGDKVGAFDQPPTGTKRTPPKYWAAFTFAGDGR